MLKILNYKQVDKGPLKASVSIETVIFGMDATIYDIAIFESNGRRWMNFPSKKVTSTHPGDKAQYFPYIKFNREYQQRFQEAFFDAVKEYLKINPQQENLPF